ncbi:Crp/Fnr family transcriptional regulator [Fusobacterium polymorphum]|uniref:Crp/Fnr family transcriptional regulator n=1 Tax=Fusobacterium nucleatum subsp. polymorphum TaxID=76857 RepID=UPI0030CFFA8E
MIEILKETVVFNGIDEKTIKNILEKTKYEIKKYSPNESIAFRGDEVRGLYIILKGTLTTEMLTEEGNVIKIEELVPSDVIASAFIFGKKNSFPVDLNAKDEAEILFIERKEFLKILFSKEKILENFLNEVSNKTQLLTSKIWNSFNNKTIKKKFCDYVKKNQKNNLFSIQNLGALAEYFGVERPSLSRVLSDLVKDEKLERIGRNKYKILDKDFLKFKKI